MNVFYKGRKEEVNENGNYFVKNFNQNSDFPEETKRFINFQRDREKKEQYKFEKKTEICWASS